MKRRPGCWLWWLTPPMALTQLGCTSPADSEPQVIRIEARRFVYQPAVITLKKNQPVVLELISKDGLHGFNAPELGLRSDVTMEGSSRLSFTPSTAGRFIFHCDLFCGAGHDEMAGEIIVSED